MDGERRGCGCVCFVWKKEEHEDLSKILVVLSGFCEGFWWSYSKCLCMFCCREAIGYRGHRV